MSTQDKNTHTLLLQVKTDIYKTVRLSSTTVAVISLINLSMGPDLQSINFKTVLKRKTVD